MKTKQEHPPLKSTQSGNVLIYVLIAIVLFAALGFSMARQAGDEEAGVIDDSKVELYATQLISYAAQAQSVVEQMMFTGTKIDQLNFILPSDAAFDTGSDVHKVFHPAGGGLNPGTLPSDALGTVLTNPVSGWYMGRFNNIQWTKTAGQDVILVAYQISQAICEAINTKITGSATIPTLGDSVREVMIDDSLYTGGSNVNFTTSGGGAICTSCDKKGSLCVKDQTLDAYAFYAVMAVE